MKQIKPAALLSLLLLLGGCKQVSKSLDVSRWAADDFSGGKAESLCDRFSDEMRAAMPCDSMERVLRQTADLDGASQGPCKWNYTYKIMGLDPFRTVTIYRCPFAKEDIKLTVVVDVTDNGAFVSGLWSDSPRIREQRLLTRVELCGSINEKKSSCARKIEKASWGDPKIQVWTAWQGVRTGDKLIMEWRDPDGKQAADFVREVEPQEPGCYYFWSWIEPATTETSSPCGRWTVKIGANGKMIEEYPVEVTGCE
ncbi:MAG TPA: hypothetical protein VM658_12740 [bacterium]|nr:hypothetical protein [bacterium]